jgi:glyoxylase-like metal-dependent hydrolase (beta-lactamase superfamily II)
MGGADRDDAGMPSIAPSAGGVRVDRVVTSGTFELDGGSWDVDNNVWVVGDDKECVIIDAAHDGRKIVKSIDRQRRVTAVISTHAHNDHINAVGEVCDGTRAPAYLHPADRMLWDELYPVSPDRELADGQVVTVGDVDLHVIHTPGHTPGSCCLYAPALDVVFTGDTLFNGGPGATGRSYSDFPTIIESIRTRLLTLPDETVVLTGHGDSTVIGAEASHVQQWLDRGH